VWPEVIGAMDALFAPSELDFDLDLGAVANAAPPTQMSAKRALIVSPSRDQRLYLRARMALAQLTQADEAESGAQALEMARAKQYDFAVVEFAVPDMDAWLLLRQLRQGKKPIRHVAVTKERRSVREHLRAWLSGAGALLGNPPNPQRLSAWLQRIQV
jgi:DNA-binding response OmpR family regulator